MTVVNRSNKKPLLSKIFKKGIFLPLISQSTVEKKVRFQPHFGHFYKMQSLN